MAERSTDKKDCKAIHQLSEEFKEMKMTPGRLTKKTRRFAKHPISETLRIEKVPGIGPAIAKKLKNEHGISLACHLFKEYQTGGEEGFKRLIADCGGNEEHQRDAYYAMCDYDGKC